MTNPINNDEIDINEIKRCLATRIYTDEDITLNLFDEENALYNEAIEQLSLIHI